MRRTNTWADATATQEAELDLGDGLSTRVPLGRPYTIDQSAGRVLKVWDHINKREQLIYGDTGFRDITALNPALPSGGTIRLRRTGNLVYLVINNVSRPAGSPWTLLKLPSGFTPSYTHVELGDLHIYSKPATARLFIQTNGSVDAIDSTDATPIYKSAVFPTADPWPTSLPGAAIGVNP